MEIAFGHRQQHKSWQMTNMVTNTDGAVIIQLNRSVETFYLPTIPVVIFIAAFVVLAVYFVKAGKFFFEIGTADSFARFICPLDFLG